MPSAAELADLQADLRSRAKVPDYVWAVLSAMPADSHPMVMLNTAILVMEKESVFRQRYDAGMKKDEYWLATLEDALNIIAVLPEVAAGVYRMRFDKGPRIPTNPALDWGADYAAMLGIPDPKGDFAKLMRLYLVLHTDHESGNVSAMTTATVNSALSDLYYSLSAGLNGLAGPLHGLANQECLAWVLETNKKFGGNPTKAQIQAYAQETLSAGRVIPGYGHAVLRITDPRFDAFLAFGKQHCADDPVFQTVANVFDTVPDILKTIQKIKDPWPNVDAGSGALLYHYGLTEFPVLHGVVQRVARPRRVLAGRRWRARWGCRSRGRNPSRPSGFRAKPRRRRRRRRPRHKPDPEPAPPASGAGKTSGPDSPARVRPSCFEVANHPDETPWFRLPVVHAMPDYSEGIKKEVVEIKFLIHDLRVERFINEVIHFHVTLNTDLELCGVDQAQILHGHDLQVLKEKAVSLRKAFQDYSNAVRNFSPDRTVLLAGRHYVNTIYGVCELVLSPLWGRVDKVLTFLPPDSRSAKARTHYLNCIHFIRGVYHRIQQFLDEQNDKGVYQEFDIAAEIEDFMRDVVYSYVMEHSNGRVQIELDRLDPAVVGGNLPRFRRMFFNLVMNAVDAMSNRDVGVLTVGDTLEGDRAVLRIRDNGVGMSPEKINSFSPTGTRSTASSTRSGSSSCGRPSASSARSCRSRARWARERR